MSTITVRSAIADDLDDLLALFPQLTTPERVYAISDRTRAAAALGRIQASPDMDLLVAVDGSNHIVGTLTLAIIHNLTANARPWMVLEAMVVDEAARRRGVGRALIERAVRIARERDCHKIELQSRNERGAAHAFYRSLGFQPLAIGFKRYLD